MTETKQRPIATAPLVFLVGYQWFYNRANFIAFKVGGDTFHPILLAALRFGIAALLILPLTFSRWGKHRPNGRELESAGLLGLVMLVGSQTLAISERIIFRRELRRCLGQPLRSFSRRFPGDFFMNR